MSGNISQNTYKILIAGSFLLGALISKFVDFNIFGKKKETNKEKKELSNETIYAGIEGGGTTWKVAIAKGSPLNIIKDKIFETTTPKETLEKIISWLDNEKFDTIGIASFGPVDLNVESKTYGYITTTPKEKWRNTNVVGPFLKYGKPIGFDTDVNGPALSELYYGNHPPETKSVCYVTVGTGIGVGIVIDGRPLHGALHPEAGHIQLKRNKNDDYVGDCEFHKDCLEGLVRISSIVNRYKLKDHTEIPSLPDNHPIWEIIGDYLAQLCVNLTLTVCPNVIVFGGGIMNRECLIPIIRENFSVQLNNYVINPSLKNLETYIVRSAHKTNSGIIGALELGRGALLNQINKNL